MHHSAAFEDVLKLVQQLSLVEKVRLIERVAPGIERELLVDHSIQNASLLGLVKDLGPAPSAAEIEASRNQAWTNFPRGNA